MKRRRVSPRPHARPESTDPEVGTRIKQFFERLDRLATNGLGQTVLPAADRDRRTEVREIATATAIAAGRRQVLDDVRRAARETALARFGSRVFRPTWVGLNWGQSLGSVEDRVALAEIFDDAAIGAVAGDLVDDDVAADLGSGLEALEANADRGPPEQSLELAIRRRPRFARAFAIWIAFGFVGSSLIGLGQFGYQGLVGATAITVVVILIALAKLAPKAPLDQVESHRREG
jgi:hypothetical protein